MSTEPVGARLPGEPPRAFHAWTVYRDLGGRRTLRETALEVFGPDEGSGKLRQIETWSARWSWRLRASAWDAHLDEIDRHEAVEAVREMRRRHAQIGVAVLNRVAARLMGGTITTSEGEQVVRPLDMSTVGVAALCRLAEIGVKIERLSRGEPEVISEARWSLEPEHHEQDTAAAMLADPALAALAAQLAAALPSPDPTEKPC